jgi:hypothetical protein
MKHILTCSDYQTALHSLSKITGIAKDNIKFFATSFNKPLDPNNRAAFLWNEFAKQFPLGKISFHISVFHGCRRFVYPKPIEDLLPNHLMIEQLWKNIWEDCSDLLPAKSSDELKFAVRKSSQSHTLFNRVHGDFERERGPWGFLIKDSLSRDNQNHYIHDYPEIITAIIRGIQEELDVDIRDRLKEKTRPYIIHFRTSKSHLRYLKTALLYLKEAYSDLPFSNYPICYSEEGNIVPANQILGIE